MLVVLVNKQKRKHASLIPTLVMNLWKLI